jgi:DNA-binding YbaB/EbfC family protein
MIDPMKLMNMLKKANDFKNKIESELKNIKAQGLAGGDIVKIDMNGQFEVENVKIDKDVFNQEDAKFLEDLLVSSINDATKKIKDSLINKVKDMANGLGFFK